LARPICAPHFHREFISSLRYMRRTGHSTLRKWDVDFLETLSSVSQSSKITASESNHLDK
jgi:hypothetical protein